jgi:2-polyprenyl-3-methyl-5-hydroxy-6-metoxy-1,4-benzoquinol methylase
LGVAVRKAEGQDFYDDAHRRFFRNWEANKLSRERCEALAKRASQYIVGSVLDLGCGFGFLSQFVERPYLGIDFSPFVIEKAQILHGKSRATFQVGDIRHLPEIEMFDTVAMLEVLEHLDNPAAAVEIAQDMARRRIVVSVPRQSRPSNRAHVWPDWTAEDVTNLLGENSECHRYRRWWIGVKEI